MIFGVFLLILLLIKDIYKEKRHKICNLVYKYQDANSCQRIVDLSGMNV